MSWCRLLVFLFLGSILFQHDHVLGSDRFYLERLNGGIEAYTWQNYETAEQELLVAAFGLMEEPPELARALVYLVLCRAELKAKEDLLDSFRRLSLLEDRFGAYTAAPLADDVRKVFEEELLKHIPQEQLGKSGFALRFVRPIDSILAPTLSPQQRRKALKKLIRKEPSHFRWRLHLARLELQQRRAKRAIREATRVLETEADHPEALEIRGLARKERGEWAAAAQDLEASGMAASSRESARALVEAYMKLERWHEARTFLESLPPAFQKESELERYLADARKALESSPTPEPVQEVPDGISIPETARVVEGGSEIPETRPRKEKNSSASSAQGASQPMDSMQLDGVGNDKSMEMSLRRSVENFARQAPWVISAVPSNVTVGKGELRPEESESEGSEMSSEKTEGASQGRSSTSLPSGVGSKESLGIDRAGASSFNEDSPGVAVSSVSSMASEVDSSQTGSAASQDHQEGDDPGKEAKVPGRVGNFGVLWEPTGLMFTAWTSGEFTLNYFPVGNPPRYVVDFMGVTTAQKKLVIPANRLGVFRLRVAEHKDRVRLVLDLDEGVEVDVREILREGSQLKVRLGIEYQSKQD